MKQTNTRAMVETAFLSAIVVMLTIIGASVPLLSLLATIVAPSAIAIVCIRWGLRYGMAASVVSFFLVSIILGPLTAIGTILMYAVPSIFLGLGFRNRWPFAMLIIVPAIALCVTTIITLLASLSVTSFDIQGALNAFDGELKEAIVTAVQQQSLPEDQMQLYMQQVETTFDQIKRMIVAYGFCAFLVLSYILARFTAYIARRTQNPVQPLPAISTWRMPIWSAGVMAIGLILVYGSSYVGLEQPWIATIGMNLGLFGAFICLVNGIACALSLMDTYRMSRILKIIIVGLLYIMSPITLVVFGIMDMFLDLRTRYQRWGSQ